jgi:hypothetical protein
MRKIYLDFWHRFCTEKAFIATHRPNFSPLLHGLSSTLLSFSLVPLASCSCKFPSPHGRGHCYLSWEAIEVEFDIMTCGLPHSAVSGSARCIPLHASAHARSQATTVVLLHEWRSDRQGYSFLFRFQAETGRAAKFRRSKSMQNRRGGGMSSFKVCPRDTDFGSRVKHELLLCANRCERRDRDISPSRPSCLHSLGAI